MKYTLRDDGKYRANMAVKVSVTGEEYRRNTAMARQLGFDSYRDWLEFQMTNIDDRLLEGYKRLKEANARLEEYRKANSDALDI